ncbi:hypothetical protein [Bdellovibrio svalbardensis]|uniref:Uncharacterized protein n=1 Tax=Bdellovibrio svalbardensis TaxID=2972972 RepID=A0ABT6DFD4_9BACT|nr:hypothetical protein [Bdellovibrio svalbardensis]MDG0815503.1 hypothetical protein [Bdellovibrio svalbardensis]
MKKIIAMLSLASLIIMGAMIYLVKKGVSLRADTLIKPSEISTNDTNVSHAVAYRLFPDFQSHDMIIVGVPEEDSRLQVLAEQIAIEAEKLLGQPIHRAADKMHLQDCGKLCWVKVKPEEAQELEKNSYIPSVIQPLGRTYFTLNLLEFSGYDAEALSACEQEKRLDLKCLVTLSVKQAERKMKDPNKRYFFMKKYEDRGNYLLLQKN